VNIGVVLALAMPLLLVAAVISFLRRRNHGEEMGHLGFRPLSPGGNPVFAPIHFGGGEATIEYVDEAWDRIGGAPRDPGRPDPADIPPL
jgi:hypothetical protein